VVTLVACIFLVRIIRATKKFNIEHLLKASKRLSYINGSAEITSLDNTLQCSYDRILLTGSVSIVFFLSFSQMPITNTDMKNTFTILLFALTLTHISIVLFRLCNIQCMAAKKKNATDPNKYSRYFHSLRFRILFSGTFINTETIVFFRDLFTFNFVYFFILIQKKET
jgi:hypothetical protein